MERLTKQWGNNPAVPGKLNMDFVFDMNNEDYTAFQDILDRLAYYEEMEEQDRLVVLPCKEGDTIYKIVKFCRENTGCYEFYRPSVEFESDCEYFEPACWYDDCESCNARIEDDDKDPWYCSLNLDILCEKCKERFAIRKDKFALSMARQVFNTPMFKENTRLEDVYYLSFEEAEEALKKLKDN